MIPSPPEKLTCPHCGAKKYIESVESGELHGATWSDYKHDLPLFPRPSPIQKCTSCHMYYFYDDSLPDKMDIRRIRGKKRDQILQESHANGFGILSYEEMNEAYEILYSDHLAEKQKRILYEKWIHAFNDKYNGRYETADWSAIPADVINRQKTILAEVEQRVSDRDVLAELLREDGRFEECIEMIGELPTFDRGDSIYPKQILEHARLRDRGVFVIQYKSRY